MSRSVFVEHPLPEPVIWPKKKAPAPSLAPPEKEAPTKASRADASPELPEPPEPGKETAPKGPRGDSSPKPPPPPEPEKKAADATTKARRADSSKASSKADPAAKARRADSSKADPAAKARRADSRSSKKNAGDPAGDIDEFEV